MEYLEPCPNHAKIGAMCSNDTKDQFLEPRAKGLSLARVATDVHASQPTLVGRTVDWGPWTVDRGLWTEDCSKTPGKMGLRAKNSGKSRESGSSGKLGSRAKLDFAHPAFMRAERAEAKARRDGMIIAQGKRSAALGKEPNMNTSLFPSSVFSRLQAWKKQNSGKGRLGVAWHLPRAAARLRSAPAGLALGYYLVAPSGRRRPADFSLLAPEPHSRKPTGDLINRFSATIRPQLSGRTGKVRKKRKNDPARRKRQGQSNQIKPNQGKDFVENLVTRPGAFLRPANCCLESRNFPVNFVFIRQPVSIYGAVFI
jgi:hypothetical protein